MEEAKEGRGLSQAGEWEGVSEQVALPESLHRVLLLLLVTEPLSPAIEARYITKELHT